MRGVRANDLIPGRNERIPVYIDGFRRPKFEKKNNYARAESGFCITYSERSQIRRRVLRPVLAETAREHVSRAMSETSASCSLITHVCLFSSGNKFAPISMKNQNCTRRTKKESSLFFCDLNFDQNKNKKKVPSFSRRSFLSLVMSLLFSLMLLGKARIKRRRRQSVVVVRKRRWWVVCLSPVVGFPL